jgi:hypothetical protein
MVYISTSPGLSDYPDIMQTALNHKYQIHFAEHLAEWIPWFADVLED